MENKDNIEIIGSGLKCDNPKCDWNDESIANSELDKWINAKCPKCNEVVLTFEDYERAMMLDIMVKVINDMTPEEIEQLSKHEKIDTDEDFRNHLKSSDFYKDAEGIDSIEKGDVSFYVSTHNEIKCTSIKNVDNNGK
jgi:hypothetical protein